MPSLSRVQLLMQLMPWGAFDAAVREHGADRWCKGFTSRQHLAVMAYAQLSGASSLRELECAFNPNRRRFGLPQGDGVRRSTLADANAHRDPAAFEAAARALMQQLGRHARAQRERMVYLLDSTTIRLCGRGFEWTEPHATRDPGLKLHVMYEANEQNVQHQEITGMRLNDVTVARQWPIEQGATYVFDKAYCDFGWWQRMDAAGTRLVTRAKSNVALRLLRQRRIPRADQGLIQADSIHQFAHRSNRGGHRNTFTGAIRRIVVARPQDAPLVLLTNDLASPARAIAQLYKQRWGVELLFKWIKQHLQVRRFLGRSENAVRIQLLVALIVYLLVLLHRNRHQPRRSLWMVLAELRHGLLTPWNDQPSAWRRHRERQAYFNSVQPKLL
jgi:putative transposase